MTEPSILQTMAESRSLLVQRRRSRCYWPAGRVYGYARIAPGTAGSVALQIVAPIEPDEREAPLLARRLPSGSQKFLARRQYHWCSTASTGGLPDGPDPHRLREIGS